MAEGGTLRFLFCSRGSTNSIHVFAITTEENTGYILNKEHVGDVLLTFYDGSWVVSSFIVNEGYSEDPLVQEVKTEIADAIAKKKCMSEIYEIIMPKVPTRPQ